MWQTDMVKSRIPLDSTARYVRINVIKFIVKKFLVTNFFAIIQFT